MAEQSKLGVRNKFDELWQIAKQLKNVARRTGTVIFMNEPTLTQLVFPDGQKMFFNAHTVDFDELERSANTWLTLSSNRV